jgi:hypothetical protein
VVTRTGTAKKKSADKKNPPNKLIKSIRFHISIWWDEDDQSIHIAMPGKRITTIDGKYGVRKGNARTHRHLFEHLARYLREDGRPAPGP